LHLQHVKPPKCVTAVVRGSDRNPVLVSVVAPAAEIETPAEAAPAAEAKGKGKGKK
jgi:large subunit ribosomal protein L25